MPRQDIIITCDKFSDDNTCSLGGLSEYIANYIAEEMDAQPYGVIDGSMVRMAIDAYQGGAR